MFTCTNCGNAKTNVLDSRPTRKTVRRRRRCPSCGERFTTYEAAVGAVEAARNAELMAMVRAVRAQVDALAAVIEPKAAPENEPERHEADELLAAIGGGEG